MKFTYEIPLEISHRYIMFPFAHSSTQLRKTLISTITFLKVQQFTKQTRNFLQIHLQGISENEKRSTCV